MTNSIPSQEFNFSNINGATARCFRLLGKSTGDNDLREHCQELLLLSAATKPAYPDQTYYRPYLVAAIMLSQDIKANNLAEASGVIFNSKAPIVQAFLASQLSIDKAQAWIITTGFTVPDIAASLGLPVSVGQSRPLSGIYPSSVPYTVVF